MDFEEVSLQASRSKGPVFYLTPPSEAVEEKKTVSAANVPPPSYRLCVDDLGSEDETASPWGKFKLGCRNTVDSLKRYRMFWRLTLVDVSSRKLSYSLSFCSVFFVVMLCLAMLSVLSSLPAVFLKLAESDSGEADLVVSAPGSANSLNYTRIRELLAVHSDSLHLNAPRIEVKVKGYALDKCLTQNERDMWYWPSGSDPPTPTNGICPNGCSSNWCTNKTASFMELIAFNSVLEDAMGFGPQSYFPHTAPRSGNAILSIEAATNLGVNVGDYIVLSASEGTNPLLAFSPPDSVYNKNFIMKLKVSTISNRAPNKFPSSSSFVLVSYTDFPLQLAASMTPQMSNVDREAVANCNPESAATKVYFRMPQKKRYDTYISTSYKEIRYRCREGAIHPKRTAVCAQRTRGGRCYQYEPVKEYSSLHWK